MFYHVGGGVVLVFFRDSSSFLVENYNIFVFSTNSTLILIINIILSFFRSGKSSIQKVVFHKVAPNETLFLESTNKIVKEGNIYMILVMI